MAETQFQPLGLYGDHMLETMRQGHRGAILIEPRLPNEKSDSP